MKGWVALTAAVPCLSAFAAIDVSIEGVDGERLENVRTSLSLTRYADQELREAEVKRLIDRVDQEVGDALKPFGHYQSRATVEYIPKGDDHAVTLVIDPGKRHRWRTVAVQINGPGRSDEVVQSVIDNRRPRRGEALDHRVYERLKTGLENEMQRRGYFDWRWERHRLEVYPNSGVADLVLQLETGPRYRIGQTEMEQTSVDDDVAERFLRFDHGDFFDQKKLLDTQYGLLDSQYFSLVQVTPGEPDTAHKEVPVTIEASPQKRRRISLGVGYGSDTRIRGSITSRWRRLNGRGHRAQLRYAGSGTKEEVSGRYEIPGRDPVHEQINLTAGYIDERLADTTSRRSTLSVSNTSQIKRWQVREYVDAIQENTSLPDGIRNQDFLIVPGIGLDRWLRDQAINPTRGFRIGIDLRGSHETLLSETNFARLTVEGRVLRSIGKRFSVLGRLAVGSAWVEDFDELPASQRYFAGGDQSVRGFGFNELSPRDDDGEVVGGQHLIFASLEGSFAVKGPWRVALFVDGGGALRRFSDPLEYSVGIGAHRDTPIGRIRLDVAKPVSLGDRSVRLHFSIQPDL